jgi:ADP-ribose pyrophosphatase YjhB (NUDIX family)
MPSYFRDPDAPTPNVLRRIGVVAAIERNEMILVQRRADDGEWDFLGGMLEEDERVLEALRREVHEETDLEPAEAKLFGIFSDPTRIIAYPDGTVCGLLSMVFVVTLAPGELRRRSESLERRFVERDELREVDVWPAVRPIRDAYLPAPSGAVVE